VVVQTEFGRRVRENQSLGTDHGRGSVMLAMGAGVHGGKVYGNWPGLRDDQLDEVGDLRVTTDYRSVLAEALRFHGHPAPRNVFPGMPDARVGLFKPA
jgi:uncharacterized protein (DUF1501 family)